MRASCTSAIEIDLAGRGRLATCPRPTKPCGKRWTGFSRELNRDPPRLPAQLDADSSVAGGLFPSLRIARMAWRNQGDYQDTSNSLLEVELARVASSLATRTFEPRSYVAIVERPPDVLCRHRRPDRDPELARDFRHMVKRHGRLASADRTVAPAPLLRPHQGRLRRELRSSPRRQCSASSAPTAPARPRACASWPRSTCPPRAMPSSTASRSRRIPTACAAGWGSCPTISTPSPISSSASISTFSPAPTA